MKKNYIVITGGAGFIGSNLTNYLLKKTNFNIISLDNYSTGKRKNHIKNKRVKYIIGENKNIFKLLKIYKKKIKVIYHFGEFSRIYQSFKECKKCFDYNITGSLRIIEFCILNKIKIIYSASSSNLGNQGKDENLSPYSWSKSKNVEFIKNSNKWFGLKYEILYFYNVYGRKQLTNNKMAAVIGIFENQTKKGEPLTVVYPGNQKRDFTNIDDVIVGCYLAFKKGKNSEYMLGTLKQHTVLQIARMFSKKIKFVKARPGERFGSFHMANNALKDLGYKPRIKIRDYINKFKYENNL